MLKYLFERFIDKNLLFSNTRKTKTRYYRVKCINTYQNIYYGLNKLKKHKIKITFRIKINNTTVVYCDYSVSRLLHI